MLQEIEKEELLKLKSVGLTISDMCFILYLSRHGKMGLYATIVLYTGIKMDIQQLLGTNAPDSAGT